MVLSGVFLGTTFFLLPVIGGRLTLETRDIKIGANEGGETREARGLNDIFNNFKESDRFSWFSNIFKGSVSSLLSLYVSMINNWHSFCTQNWREHSTEMAVSGARQLSASNGLRIPKSRCQISNSSTNLSVRFRMVSSQTFRISSFPFYLEENVQNLMISPGGADITTQCKQENATTSATEPSHANMDYRDWWNVSRRYSATDDSTDKLWRGLTTRQRQRHRSQWKLVTHPTQTRQTKCNVGAELTWFVNNLFAWRIIKSFQQYFWVFERSKRQK